MKTSIVSIELIENRIHIIRGQRVMLDQDLARLYQVETKKLIQAIKRNIERFPEDFMFQLSSEELENWRSQIVTSNLKAKMGLRRKPYAFTEQGVAMLSSVLRSPQAVKVNIEIMRAFVRIRHVLESSKELAKVVFELRSFMLKNSNKTDQEIKRIWDAIEKLSGPPPDSTPMGFKLN
jgi:DNA-binding PadR family transcriptional regulator